MVIPEHLICILMNLYIDQEVTVRTGYGTMEWFKIEKIVTLLIQYVCQAHHEKYELGESKN